MENPPCSLVLFPASHVWSPDCIHTKPQNISYSSLVPTFSRKPQRAVFVLKLSHPHNKKHLEILNQWFLRDCKVTGRDSFRIKSLTFHSREISWNLEPVGFERHSLILQLRLAKMVLATEFQPAPKIASSFSLKLDVQPTLGSQRRAIQHCNKNKMQTATKILQQLALSTTLIDTYPAEKRNIDFLNTSEACQLCKRWPLLVMWSPCKQKAKSNDRWFQHYESVSQSLAYRSQTNERQIPTFWSGHAQPFPRVSYPTGNGN